MFEEKEKEKERALRCLRSERWHTSIPQEPRLRPHKAQSLDRSPPGPRAALTRGGDGHLIKSIDRNQLTQVINTWVSKVKKEPRGWGSLFSN